MTKSMMLAGTVGHVKGVPHPLTGAGNTANSDSEVRELLSGARASWRAPVTYQTLDLSWRGTREATRHLRDLYNRRWGGPGYFWIVPPDMDEDGNMLPMRWSVGHQLAYMFGGLGKPSMTNTGYVKVVGGVDWALAATNNTTPRWQGIVEPGTEYYFSMRALSSGLTATQGVVVDAHKIGASEDSWVRLGTYRNSTAPTRVLTRAQSVEYDFIRVSFSMPASGSGSLSILSMELSHIDYYTTEEGEMRAGSGLGAVEITSTLDGSILSNKIDRVGYGMTLTEVEI